ncbi:MAG: Holliday junction branch migration protein RuvA [Clostridia bacterium]
MYYYIKGTLQLLLDSFAVLETGGIGYKIIISKNTFSKIAAKINKEVTLYTYLAIRDDAMDLYGFVTNDEHLSFVKLLAVSGIGPKAAMSILSIMTPEQLSAAVSSGDAKAISAANGVGLKTAQKVIIELKGKLDLSDDALLESSTPSVMIDAVNALAVLGYTRGEAANAFKDIDMSLPFENIITLALKKLNKL